ncbi:hypothetical protein D3C75_1373060 [compost metagenome]
MQRVNAEAVIEVGAKVARTHLGSEVAVGSGDQAHVHPVLAVRTQALQLAALQHA